MTDAPERIWLTNFHKDEYGAKLGRGVISDLDHGDNPDYPEYIRADLAHHIDTQDAEIKSLQTKLVLAHGQAEEALEVVATQDAKIAALVEALEKVLVEYDKLDNFEPDPMALAYFAALAAIAAAKKYTGEDTT